VFLRALFGASVRTEAVDVVEIIIVVGRFRNWRPDDKLQILAKFT
jgi:hypothetical protein